MLFVKFCSGKSYTTGITEFWPPPLEQLLKLVLMSLKTVLYIWNYAFQSHGNIRVSTELENLEKSSNVSEIEL